MRFQICWPLLTVALCPALALADFTPPIDGKVTEKQVTDYLTVIRDQAKTEMSPEEFHWVAGQLNPLWPIALKPKEWDEKAKPALDKQIKFREADVVAAQARLTQYEKAQKDGTRVMTPAERDAAVANATGERNQFANEVKTDLNAIGPIGDEIKQHEQADTDAEALATNPPATVAEKDRTAYIDARKNQAQTASDAAQRARDHLKEMQKLLDNAKARLQAAQAKVDHPELPATESEKGWVLGENHAAIQSTKKTLSDEEQVLSVLKPILAATPSDKPHADNLALAKKHAAEYLDAVGVVTKPPTTRPVP